MILFIFSEEEMALLMQIYTDYYPLLKFTARRIVNNNDTADDMVQDSIIKLMNYLTTLQKLNKNQLISYCVRTVESVSISYIRHESTRRKKPLETQVPEYMPAELIEIDEVKNTVNTMLSKLSQQDRHLLIYKYFMNYSNKEIGYLLGIETKQVSTYIQRARERAKRILEKTGDST